jgi:hypothetical protein
MYKNSGILKTVGVAVIGLSLLAGCSGSKEELGYKQGYEAKSGIHKNRQALDEIMKENSYKAK